MILIIEYVGSRRRPCAVLMAEMAERAGSKLLVIGPVEASRPYEGEGRGVRAKAASRPERAADEMMMMMMDV